MTAFSRVFSILLEANISQLIQLFQRLYHKLAIPLAETRPSVRHSRVTYTKSQTRLQIDDGKWELPTAYPKLIHNIVWYDAVRHVRSHMVLHGAGIAHNGQGTLLLGHSMSGKTTLSLALMQRGAKLLTDDVIGIEYASGALCALARQVQIRPKTHQLLNLPTTPIIQPSPPYPLKNLFLVGNSTPPLAHQLRLDVQAAPLAWQQQLEQHPNVQRLTLTTLGKGWLRCQLALSESAARCYPAIEQLCDEHGVLIYDVQTVAEREASFADRAVIRPIPPSEAAFQLLEHAQNRALSQQFGGEIPLYMTVLAQLQNTACYHLQIGTPADTSKKVFDLLSA